MSAQTSPRADADAETGGDLAAAGARALAAGDPIGVGVALHGAALLSDPDDRLRTCLAIARPAITRPPHPRVLGRLLAGVAGGLLDALDVRPAEPQLLNLCALALYELGAPRAAHALLTAASRLDPTLPHLDDNLAACAAPRRAVALPPDLRTARARAERRATTLAALAVPATEQTMSLCMIVKDEEEMLPRCLEAVAGVVDELVVVDTGSTDRTVDIARSFGARVLHHTWDGDFAAARNVALDAATGDWILSLDADEVLVAEDAQRLRDLRGRIWRSAFFLTEINHVGDLGDGTASTHTALRVWRNRPQMRFEGRIHEQIAQHLPAQLPERLEHTDVRIEHFGYLSDVRAARDKATRNVELLRRQLEDGDDSAFLHYNLGSEHLAAGDLAGARRHLARSWEILVADGSMAGHGFVPSLAVRYVRTLRAMGDPAFHARAAEALERFPDFTDIVLEQGRHAVATGDVDRGIALHRRCLELGDAPARWASTVGAGGSIARVGLSDALVAAGRPAEAEAVLEESLSLDPGFLGSVNPLATLQLVRGVPGHEVVRDLHARVARVTPSVRFLLAVALHERGQAHDAEQELAAVLDAEPDNAYARVALAEALLSQARLTEAAAVAGAVPASSPTAPAAPRTELVARMASGAREGVAEAARARLPAADAQVFAGWPGDGGVPLEGADLCATMLDALARLEAFDAFEALAVSVDRGTVPWRRARELLATTYLRRGFLESAADEWIAVLRDVPRDAAALRGLAAVATQRGFDEDAAAFLAEAELVGV